MGLFNALKKKKELPELETPPPAEEAPADQQVQQPSMPAYSMEPFPEQPEMPLQSFQDVPLPPDDMRVQTPQVPQQSVMQPPLQQFSQQQQVDFPVIHPQPTSCNQQPSVEPPQMPKEALSLFQPSPQFKFYAAPAEEHFDVQSQEQIPFDVRQELLTLPREAKMQESVKSSVPRRFLTVSMLMDVGEQLINMNDDIALGKDTVFRLGDLNEQEIEQMAKWYALHQSMELRLAEMDKILFKA